jgi:uncharacterized protein YoxC
MSRATISGGGSDGLYTIVLYPDNSKIDEKIDSLNGEIIKLEQEIEDKQLEVDDLDADLEQLRKDVDDAIHNLEIARDHLGDNATQYITQNISAINSAITTLSTEGTPLYGFMRASSIVSDDSITALREELAIKDTSGLLSDKIAALQAESDALVEKAESNDAEFADGVTQSLDSASALQDAVTAKKNNVTSEKDDLAQSIGGLETNKAAGIWEMYDRTDALESAMSDLITEIRNIDPQWEQDLSSEISDVNTSIDELRTSISRGDDDLSDEIANVKSAMDKLDKSIKVRDGDAKDELEDANKAVLELAKASKEWRTALYQLKILKAQKLSKEKKVQVLGQAKLPESEASAWCADLSEDLSGEVGIIEVDGQTEESRIIQPGYSGAAVYNQSRDGCLQSPYSLTVSGAFVNWAVFPGWQKWTPTYKIGEITSLDKDADTCSVDITPSYSNCQYFGIASHLPTYYKDSYDNVPVSYMNCDADAFEVGDSVVVKFTGQDKDSPVVIGFVSHPKKCPLFMFYGWYVFHWSYYATKSFSATFSSDDWDLDFFNSSPLFNRYNEGLFDITFHIGGQSILLDRIVTSGPFVDRANHAASDHEWGVAFIAKANNGKFTLQVGAAIVSTEITAVPDFMVEVSGPGINELFHINPGPIYEGTFMFSTATFSQSISSESLFRLMPGDGLTEE